MWLWVPHFPLNSDPPLYCDMKEFTSREKSGTNQLSGPVLVRSNRGKAA